MAVKTILSIDSFIFLLKRKILETMIAIFIHIATSAESSCL